MEALSAQELSLDEIKYLGEDLALYYPLAWSHANYHMCEADVRWLFGGNQSSKTHTNMMDLAMLVMDTHPKRYAPKGTHWACIESWEQCRDILWEEKLKQFIPAHMILEVQHGQRHIPKKVYLKNGHVIEFKAFNQGRALFQGRAIHSCYCDEQCRYDFLAILHEIQARLMKHNGQLSWSMTPIDAQADLEERIEDLPETDRVFYANLNDNRISRGGYIPDRRIDAMIDEWPKEVQTTRIEGRFASFYGSVYKTFSRQVHVCRPFMIPRDWERYGAIDFGFTNPFVFLWLARDKDKNWYVYREYYEAGRTIGEHIAALKPILKRQLMKEIYADPENAGDRASLRKEGIKTRAARKDVARGIEVVQTKLKVKRNSKPSLYIFSNCRNTCRQIAAYHYPKGTTTKNPADVPQAVNDHTVDALRYGLYSVERPKAKGSVHAA